MTRPDVPKWTDEEAVTKLVKEVLEDNADWEEYNFYCNLDWDTHPDIPMSEAWAGVERDAVKAAMRGDIRPLAVLLRPEYPLNQPGHPFRSGLSPATWSLVADFLTGERNPRTGRLKGEPGRPKMSADERRAANPVHDAADEVRAIELILRNRYPEQTKAQIRDRALLIAAERAGVGNSETVQHHMARAKKDRRRIK